MGNQQTNLLAPFPQTSPLSPELIEANERLKELQRRYQQRKKWHSRPRRPQVVIIYRPVNGRFAEVASW